MLRECINGGTRQRTHSATFSQHGSMKSSPRTCLDRSMLGLVSEFQRMRWRMGPPNQPLPPRCAAIRSAVVCRAGCSREVLTRVAVTTNELFALDARITCHYRLSLVYRPTPHGP